jgi:copper chaperone NosL
MLSILFFTFVAFGIIAMIDFWRWEYDYGHNLDPAAAIIVPGMAYQPPLIGFKQLLNFGAYSIPDIGGVLFILSGIFMLIGMWLEQKSKKMKTTLNLILITICFGGISGCSNDQPVSIKYNSDPCDFCRMTIVDPRFSCELKTDHGKAYKFDDIGCMTSFVKEQKTEEFKIKTYFVSNYLNNNALINTENLTFIQGDGISSPMGGGIAAFSSLDSAIVYKNYFTAKDISWKELLSN